MLEILEVFCIFGFYFFGASYRDILPTLLKNCYTDFKSCLLFTTYLVYSLDLAVLSLTLLQIRRNLGAEPF